MISKSYGNTVWFMFGRADRPDPFFTRAWMRQVIPPYLAGHGISISFKRWTLRFGVCTPLFEDVNLDDEADVATHNLPHWETDADVQEITTWDSSEEEQNQSQSVSLEPSEQENERLDSASESYLIGLSPPVDL